MDINFLRTHFIYNPEKGEILLKKDNRKLNISTGVIRVMLNNLLFRMSAGKLAWSLHYGVIPKHPVFHKNRKRTDIKITNIAKPICIEVGEELEKFLTENPNTCNVHDLAKKFDTNVGQIVSILTKSKPHLKKLVNRTNYASLTHNDFNELDTMRMTIKEIAHKLGRSYHATANAVNEYNIPYKKSHQLKDKSVKFDFEKLKEQAEKMGFKIANIEDEGKIFKPSPKINLNKKNAVNFINELKCNLFNIDNLHRHLQLNTNDVLKDTTIKLIIKELVKNGIIEQISKNSKTYKRLRQISSDEVQDFILVKKERA